MSRLVLLLPAAFRKMIFIGIALLRRPMTLGVKIVVTDQQGRVFLVRHTYVPGWHFPGGGVERGETVQQSAQKELREECNIEVDEPLKAFHVYRNTATSRFDHVVLYLCTRYRQIGPKVPDHEIAESGFFALGELPEGTTKQTQARLTEIFDEKPPQDIW